MVWRLPFNDSLAVSEIQYVGEVCHVALQTAGRGRRFAAMHDDAIFLTYRVDCIASKPPATTVSAISTLGDNPSLRTGTQ